MFNHGNNNNIKKDKTSYFNQFHPYKKTMVCLIVNDNNNNNINKIKLNLIILSYSLKNVFLKNHVSN